MSLANGLARVQEERASPENPQTNLSNPSDWLIDLLGGSPTKSKVRVNPQTAMRFNTVYACITLLSETIAQLPLVLYRRDGEGRVVVTDHPVARLIRNPNPHMTSYFWRETVMGHTLGWGNGYSYILRNGRGQPVRLQLLLPDRTTAELIDGDVVWHTTINNQRIPILAEDLLHFPAFGSDGIRGISPIAAHAETIGAAIAAQQFGASFFGNGAKLGGVLSHPKTLSPEAKLRLKQAWDALKGGGYAGTAVLEEDLKYETIGIPPDDAQFIETRKFSRSEIASIYKIPPHMVGDLEKATFSNITEQSIQYLRYTMMPWIVKLEQELDRKLLTEEEQGEYFLKFTVQGLLRGTQDERYKSYQTGIQSGFLNRNEVRRWEELNPVDGLDEFLEPMNMAEAGSQGDGNNVRSLARFMPFVVRCAEVLERLQQTAIDRVAKRTQSVEEFREQTLAWLSDPKTDQAVIRNLEPLAEAFMDSDLIDDFRYEFAQRWARELECEQTNVDDYLVMCRSSVIEFFKERYSGGNR